MNGDFQILHEKIASSGRNVITAHTHPDGDAIGSCLGLKHFLTETCGKSATVILPDTLPENLSFLWEGENIIVASENPEAAYEAVAQADMIFMLDGNSFDRTAELEQTMRSAGAFKVLIDHHLDPHTDEFDIIFSSDVVSSTCEELYYLLLEQPQIQSDPAKLPAATARALMSGMTTDTNNFANSVFPRTLRMASELIAAGVDRDSILENIYNNYRENRYRLQGFLLDKIMKITPDGVAYIILDKETDRLFDVLEGETDGFVNIPLGIRKVCMSIFLHEDNGYFRISIRSRRHIMASDMAVKYFHGGGHPNAAGGKLWFKERDGQAPDICSKGDAAAYIEKITHEFLCGK
ncbi:MAG: DHH family phosphoesterase [Bacteroidales bacterium]|nr:DHH family phosphoesterase [Bacteroidales bacterium]